jgi:hypothetical protein
MSSLLTKSLSGVQKASSGLLKGATDTLRNANIQVIIGVVLVLYIAFIESSHDSVLRYFLTNPIGKIIVLCVAVLLAIVSPGLAILFTIFILISMPSHSPLERFQDGETDEEKKKKEEEEAKAAAAAAAAATESSSSAGGGMSEPESPAEGFTNATGTGEHPPKSFMDKEEGFSSCSANPMGFASNPEEEAKEGFATRRLQPAEGLAFAENNGERGVEGFSEKQLFSAYQ